MGEYVTSEEFREESKIQAARYLEISKHMVNANNQYHKNSGKIKRTNEELDETKANVKNMQKSVYNIAMAFILSLVSACGIGFYGLVFKGEPPPQTEKTQKNQKAKR